MFLKVAVSSLLSRRGSAVMTLMAISVAIFVLLGMSRSANKLAIASPARYRVLI